MARDLLNVWIALDRIHCHDEGDGWGNAEPYLWTVFFKIDGTSVELTDTLALAGAATIAATPGSHGNLSETSVDAGDDVSVPEAIGSWQTLLSPIPVPEWVTQVTGIEDLPAIAGVICVLMEEDNVSDDGANAGHAALNAAIQSALDEIIASLEITPSSTPEDVAQQIDAAVAELREKVTSAVTDAVRSQQGVFENIWSWLNADDTIGFEAFRFDHDALSPGNIIDFSKRWDTEGDWEIFGHANASAVCPAEAIGRTASQLTRGFSYELAALREFRSKEFAAAGHAKTWWSLAARSAPQLTYHMLRDPEMLRSTAALLRDGTALLNDRKLTIADEYIAHAERVLSRLKAGRDRRARVDASRALSVLPMLRGKTLDQSIQLLSTIEPSRHPRANRDPRLRLKRVTK